MMLFAQSAIGATNDVFDRELDAETKPSKPLPSGVISLGSGVALALVCVTAALALAATLGSAPFALGLCGLACGLAYDAGLKRNPLSAVPFMIAIPTLPLWVWVSLERWDSVLWWIAPLGALIGLSLHVANTLPDIESDAAHGIRGLAHVLGRRRSMALAWSSFGVALALAIVIAPAVAYDLRIFVPTIVWGALCLAVSILFGAIGERFARPQLAFGIMAVGAAASAVGWLAAAT
jgi:4-hydroxybenzoate polyprenyltransferase